MENAYVFIYLFFSFFMFFQTARILKLKSYYFKLAPDAAVPGGDRKLFRSILPKSKCFVNWFQIDALENRVCFC